MSRTVHAAPPTTDLPEAGGILRLDYAALEKQNIVTPKSRRSLLGEEVRLIRSRIMQNVNTMHDKVVVFTSSSPNEGKSYSALNVALSAAIDKKMSVLLIDADISQPGIRRALRLKAMPGLTDVLTTANAPLKNYLWRCDTLPLTFLQAGNRIDSATDLFASQRMTDLLQYVSQQNYDLIVVDAPPVLACTEAAALAAHAGQVAFIVDAHSSSRAAVQNALDMLPTQVPVRFILNRTSFLSSQYQFGRYYAKYNKD